MDTVSVTDTTLDKIISGLNQLQRRGVLLQRPDFWMDTKTHANPPDPHPKTWTNALHDNSITNPTKTLPPNTKNLSHLETFFPSSYSSSTYTIQLNTWSTSSQFSYYFVSYHVITQRLPLTNIQSIFSLSTYSSIVRTMSSQLIPQTKSSSLSR